MPTVYGVHLEDIPEGATAIEALVIVKALDENGEHCLYRRGSEALTPWDTIGMLTIILDRARDAAQEGYGWDHADEEEETDP